MVEQCDARSSTAFHDAPQRAGRQVGLVETATEDRVAEIAEDVVGTSPQQGRCDDLQQERVAVDGPGEPLQRLGARHLRADPVRDDGGAVFHLDPGDADDHLVRSEPEREP